MTTPPAIEVDAATVAAAPVLGYEIAELVQPDDETPGLGRQLRIRQPWIAIERTPVTIDVDLFAECSPFDALLLSDTTTAAFVSSLPDALADFATRWEVSPGMRERILSSPPNETLFVFGGGIEALVWPDGMVIGTDEPLMTTLKLLIADFSLEARDAYVYANPEGLQAALDLLPADVKTRHVPDTDKFSAQALHQRSVERQRKLNALAQKHRGHSPND